ncbi:hypothetical protein [Streptomyces sp. 6N223]|uniref:hypothetical protein n=1 Tax=Streptomyces sp. 6N223 TaxID=3457412 RepID=UPI003FD61EF2
MAPRHRAGEHSGRRRAGVHQPASVGSCEPAETGTLDVPVTAVGATPDGEPYDVKDLPGGVHRVGSQRAGETE